MADTARTLAELQALFADNSSGAISPQDLRDFLQTYADTKMLQSAYGDYLFSGYALRGGGSAPTFKVFRGTIYAHAFPGTGAATEAFFSIHLLHDLKVGTDLTFHVHWGCNSAVPAGNVKWMIDYTIARGYGVEAFPAATTLTSTQAVGAQYVHKITPDDNMTVTHSTATEPDAIILGRVYRDPTDAADTSTDDAFLFGIDMHYQIGQVATQERNRPFTSAGF